MGTIFWKKVLTFVAVFAILLPNLAPIEAAIFVVTDPVNDTTQSVLINEVVFQPTAGGPEWVEIYNNSSSTLDLTNWSIRDATGSGADINLSGTIAAGQVRAFAFSGNVLNNSGVEDIFLVNNSGTTIDRVQYDNSNNINNLTINSSSGQNLGSTGSGESFGRVTDGSTTWQVFELPTAGLANNTPTSRNLVFADTSDFTCNLQAPCYKTIGKAIDIANSGAVVKVRPGTYSENLTISKPLALLGDSGNYTLSGGGSGVGITIASGSVTVKNANIGDFATGIAISAGVLGAVVVNNNTFTNNTVAVNNQSSTAIDAKNNDWGTGNLADIERLIIHSVDSSSLGTVDYSTIVTASGVKSYQVLGGVNLGPGGSITKIVGTLTFKATAGSGGATIVAGQVSGSPLEGTNTKAVTFDSYYTVDVNSGASINWPIRFEVPYNDSKFPTSDIANKDQLVGFFFYNDTLSSWQSYDDLGGLAAAGCTAKMGTSHSPNTIWIDACHLTTFVASADTTKPTVSKDFKAETNPTSLDSVKVSWQESDDNLRLVKYIVRWKHEATGEEKSAEVDNKTSEYLIRGLTREGKYYVTVNAYDWGGNISSSSLDLWVDRTGPAKPTLTLGGVGQGTVYLSWEKVLDAIDYIIWYGRQGTKYDFAAKVGNVGSYQVKRLPSETFYFALTALDQIGNKSAFSNEVNTGPIIGSVGTAPDKPAEGFAPAKEILGQKGKAGGEKRLYKVLEFLFQLWRELNLWPWILFWH
ncbi:MAG: lamin tail domain-containing protein [Candidatus Curtissbacteria bacterium]|nr:lamin tail domain-containing protein [Candidatus Curtissbacteria bacterium]